MVGANPDGGWSRLRTDRDLGDFELRCRLRILGKNMRRSRCSIISASCRSRLICCWQLAGCRVAVNAGRVTATCNGLAIETGIGIDSARRRWTAVLPCMRAGARLEVRDARFRELIPASSAVP